MPLADQRLDAGERDGYPHMRDLVTALPMLDAVLAGQDDEGRVERWARELCRISGFDPDAIRRDPDGSQPEWTFYCDDARAAMALADAERTTEVERDQAAPSDVANASNPWAQGLASLKNRACMCHACVKNRGEWRVIMHLCPQCGNKCCPKASDHRLACTGSNAVEQPGSVF